MQATAFCSDFYHVGSFQIGSLLPPGIWLRDLWFLFSPQFILVTPSIVKGGGVVREYICSCTNIWADIAMCRRAPLGSTSWQT